MCDTVLLNKYLHFCVYEKFSNSEHQAIVLFDIFFVINVHYLKNQVIWLLKQINEPNITITRIIAKGMLYTNSSLYKIQFQSRQIIYISTF